MDNEIIAFIFDLGKGGAQGVFVTLVNYLHSKGVLSKIVVGNLKENDKLKYIDEGISIVDLKCGNAKKFLLPLKKFLEENTFACAIAFSPEIACDLFFCKKWFKREFRIYGRCINTLSVEFAYTRSFFRKYITQNLIKKYYHKIDYSIAQSKGMKEDLIQNFNFKEDQVRVINNALSVKFEEELNNENMDNKQGQYFLYVGRLEEQKGLTMLIDAYVGMKDKSKKLMIVGQGSLKNFLIQYVEGLNLSDKVEFVNYTNEIISYYKNAFAVVLSSLYEGFPNVLIEAIACGTPIIAYDLPSGPDEIIENGINGYLVDYLKINKLREAMDKAISTQWDKKIIKKTATKYRSKNILSEYYDFLIS